MSSKYLLLPFIYNPQLTEGIQNGRPQSFLQVSEYNKMFNIYNIQFSDSSFTPDKLRTYPWEYLCTKCQSTHGASSKHCHSLEFCDWKYDRLCYIQRIECASCIRSNKNCREEPACKAITEQKCNRFKKSLDWFPMPYVSDKEKRICGSTAEKCCKACVELGDEMTINTCLGTDFCLEAYSKVIESQAPVSENSQLATPSISTEVQEVIDHFKIGSDQLKDAHIKEIQELESQLNNLKEIQTKLEEQFKVLTDEKMVLTEQVFECDSKLEEIKKRQESQNPPSSDTDTELKIQTSTKSTLQSKIDDILTQISNLNKPRDDNFLEIKRILQLIEEKNKSYEIAMKLMSKHAHEDAIKANDDKVAADIGEYEDEVDGIKEHIKEETLHEEIEKQATLNKLMSDKFEEAKKKNEQKELNEVEVKAIKEEKEKIAESEYSRIPMNYKLTARDKSPLHITSDISFVNEEAPSVNDAEKKKLSAFVEEADELNDWDAVSSLGSYY